MSRDNPIWCAPRLRGALLKLGTDIGWRMINALRRLLWRLWCALEYACVRHVQRSRGYSFTADYVTSRTHNWMRLLEPYRDAVGVRMLEIGSFEGRSMVWFVENILTHPTARIVCVDLFRGPAYNVRFDHNVGVLSAPGKVTKIAGPSHRVLREFPKENFDIIYVDGSHRAADVLLDSVMSWYLLKTGGIMLLDDYQWKMDMPPERRPEMAIDLFLRVFEGRFDLLLKEYQVAVRKLPTYL